MAGEHQIISEPPPGVRQLRRLGKNINGYFGQTIQIDAVLRDTLATARAHGWAVETMAAIAGWEIVALTRARRGAAGRRVYLSTGIHGDEPAGPLAVLELLRQDRWPAEMALWVCPCLNPAGFRMNRRENAQGLDLNREYLNPQASETLAHIEWLKRQPSFDLSLCLHEDWESEGFYVYELNPEGRPSLAEAIVAAAAGVCPIDSSSLIEGRPAQNGIIRPSIDPRNRPQWPEAFFLLTHKTRLSYTIEAPSDFPLRCRVAALAAGAQAAVERLACPPASLPAGGTAVPPPTGGNPDAPK